MCDHKREDRNTKPGRECARRHFYDLVRSSYRLPPILWIVGALLLLNPIPSVNSLCFSQDLEPLPPLPKAEDSRTPRWSYRFGEEVIAFDPDPLTIVVRLRTDPTELPDQQVLLNSLSLIIDSDLFHPPQSIDLTRYPGLALLRLQRPLSEIEQLEVLKDLERSEVVEFASLASRAPDALLIPRPEVWVVLEKVDPEGTLARILEHGILSIKASFPSLYPTWLLQIEGAPLDSFQVAEALRAIDGVRFTQPNFIRRLENHSRPSDTLFPSQWNLENNGQFGGTSGADIRALEAWEIESGNPSITIAIIDEGVDLTHPDLIGQIVAGYDAVGAVTPPPGGMPGNAASQDAHGTACAGIAAATGDNQFGIAGVCWNASIMSVRIGFGDFWTQDDWVVDGITWATDMGADVLSNSWGGGPGSTIIQGAIQYANAVGRGGLGTPTVFSSGNGDINQVAFPASLPETIAVGASTPCDERKSSTSCDGEWWWGSQYGPALDLVAPGPKVTTTDNFGPAGYVRSHYVEFSGTSSAAPHVAGAIALLLSSNSSFTADELRQLLRQSAAEVGPVPYVSGRNDEMGYGRLDLLALLVAAGAGVNPPLGVECRTISTDTQLSWVNGETYASIEIERDGVLIATLPGSETNYTDTTPGLGLFQYTLRGITSVGASPGVLCSTVIIGAATDLVWSPVAGAVAGGPPIAAALSANGRLPLLVQNLADGGSLDQYSSVWVNVGVFPDTYQLTTAEGVALADYLQSATSTSQRYLYLEGGDTWFFDSNTPVHDLLGIEPVGDGPNNPSENLGTIVSVPSPSCALPALELEYSGENQFIDRINPLPGSSVLLQNQSPSFEAGIARDSGTYRTLGTNFEIAGISETGNSQADLVGAILDCWGLPTVASPLPQPIQNFNCQDVFGAIQLNWVLGDSYDGIRVTRNDLLIAILPGTAQGLVDATPAPGVNVYQVQGTALGADSPARSCVSQSALPVNRLTIEDNFASVGEAVTIPVLAEHQLPLEGYTMGFIYDPSVLQVTSLTTAGTVLEVLGAEFFVFDVDSIAGTATATAMLDAIPPITEAVPPGVDQVILNILGTISVNAPPGSITPLALPESLGSPPVVTAFLENGVTAYPPERDSGTLTVLANTNLGIALNTVSGSVGEPIDQSIFVSTDRELRGFSFGIPFDSAQITPSTTTLSGTIADGADYSEVEIDVVRGFLTASVILDLVGPIELTIPVGGDLPVFRISWIVDLAVQESTSIPVQFQEGLGMVPVPLALIDLAGNSLSPTIENGAILVTTPPTIEFIRGDMNLDGAVDVSDPIGILSWIFEGHTASCLDAADANDDGFVDIGDPIYLLGFQFSNTAPPPVPFPQAGPDPTADNLECDQGL